MKQGTPPKKSAPPRAKSSSRQDSSKEDVVAARRRVQERRKKARRNIPYGSLLFVACTIVVSASMFMGIKKRYSEYYRFRDQVVERRAQLAALDKELAAKKARLAMLESKKGRSQLLIERGYIHPGERILLFPETPGAKLATAKTNPETGRSNESAATVAAANQGPSAWSNFWRKVRGLPPETAPKP